MGTIRLEGEESIVRFVRVFRDELSNSLIFRKLNDGYFESSSAAEIASDQNASGYKNADRDQNRNDHNDYDELTSHIALCCARDQHSRGGEVVCLLLCLLSSEGREKGRRLRFGKEVVRHIARIFN